jgi:hypothetical protein
MKKCQPRLLTPYIDGELTPDARGEMEEHLQSCPSCGAMLDEVTQAYLHVRAMGRAAIPPTSLRPAIELFAERAGLELGSPALRDTVEVAREPGPAGQPDPVEMLDVEAPLLTPLRPRALTQPPDEDHDFTAEAGATATTEAALEEDAQLEPVEPTDMETEVGDEPAHAESEPEMVAAIETDQPEVAEDTEAEVAREPVAEVAEEPVAEDMPEPPIAVEPPVAEVPPSMIRPTTADAPAAGLLDEQEPEDIPYLPAPEPMAPLPETTPTGVEHEGAEAEVDPAPEQMELAEPEATIDAEAPAADDTGAADVVGAEPLDLHAEAPPGELRPPWLSEEALEGEALEADGRAAVDDAIEAEAAEAAAADAGTGADGEGEDDPGLESADLTPPNPIPDPGPASRPESRLEPPPEPWTTVWRPGKGADVEPSRPWPDAEPEPAAAEALRFEIPQEAPNGPEAAHDEVTLDHPEIDADPTESTELDTGDRDSHPGFERRGTGWADADQPLPEVEEAMARLRGDLRPGVVEPETPSPDDGTEVYDSIDEYRSALHDRPAPRRGFLGLDLRSRADQVKVGAVAAVILLLVAGATTVALTSNRQATTSGTVTQAQPSAAASAPLAQASAAPSAAASPPASGAIPQLSAPVGAGAGGIGWTASKIRGGSPGNGITRIVVEVSGAGPTPTAQLGRGPDGAAYLVASGISVDPAVVQAFKGTGLVTGVSQVGTDGLGLKMTLNGSPQYAMVYLSSPTRLVIDFK